MTSRDRRALFVLLESRLQSRISDLSAWAKTMLLFINQSVRDARAQLHTGHQDTPTYSSDMTVAAVATTTTPATATATSTARITVHLLDFYQRFERARTRIATLSTDIRRFFPSLNSTSSIHRFANNTRIHDLKTFSTGRGVILASDHFLMRHTLQVSTTMARSSICWLRKSASVG
jgi:hypothetical protein